MPAMLGAVFVVLALVVPFVGFGAARVRKQLAIREGVDLDSPPQWRLQAAEQQHASDRAWRLDEWNRGRAHPSRAQRHRLSQPAREEVERRSELDRWNGNRPRLRPGRIGPGSPRPG